MSPEASTSDEPVMAWFEPRGSLAVYLFEYDGRGVAVWTDIVNGKRECVGIEIKPLSEAWADETVERARTWATGSMGIPEPITRVWLQGVPLGAMMAEAARTDESFRAVRWAASAHSWAKPGPTRERVRLLSDALIYVARIRAGSRTPAKDLADRCGYTLATARARIADARKLGLLTSAGAGVVGGELTEEALDLLRREAQHPEHQEIRSLASAAGIELEEAD